MKTFTVLFSIFAICKAARILPIDTSEVNVKSEHSGQDYSYSIHENRGFAFDPAGEPLHHQQQQHQIPVLKTVTHAGSTNVFSGGEFKQTKEHHEIQAFPQQTQTLVKALPQLSELTYVAPQALTHPTYYLPTSYYPYAYTYPYAYHGNYNLLAYRAL